MQVELAEFPMQTIDEVKLNKQELTAIKTKTQTKLIKQHYYYRQ